MTTTTTDDPLRARAKALKLYGLLDHWPEVAGAAWVEPLIQWEVGLKLDVHQDDVRRIGEA